MVPLNDYLRHHPFPVRAFFERVVAVSFAFPEDTLRPLVSRGLEIDAYNGLGFVTAAMVWTRNLRPAGLPKFFGQDFFLCGYRIFTRLNDGQRRLRGLQILRSETDRRRMVWLGNRMTHYRYRHVNVRIAETDGRTRIETSLADGTPTACLTIAPVDEAAPLPDGSPFPNWHTARRFAGPMPFTFSAESNGKFVVIEGSRQEWVPHPVSVEDWRIGLFDEAPFHGTTPILANAFVVSNVCYRWKRGRVVHMGGAA
jgi:hypothetical protein